MVQTTIEKNTTPISTPTYSQINSNLPMCTTLIHSNDGIFTRFGNWISQRNLLTELTDLSVLAGGALLWEFDENHPETNDLDLFVLNNNKTAFKTILKRICQYYNINNVNVYSNIDEHSICTIVINKNLIFQVILTNHSTPREVIENFDLDYVKIYHYQGVTEADNKAIAAMTTHKIINIDKFKLYRAIKAIKKGFEIPLLTNLLNKQYIQDTINKPRLTAKKNISLREMLTLPLKPFSYHEYSLIYVDKDINPQFKKYKCKTHTYDDIYALSVKMPLQKNYTTFLPVKIKLDYIKHLISADNDDLKSIALVKFNFDDELIKYLLTNYPATINEKYKNKDTIKCYVPRDIASKMKSGKYYFVKIRVIMFKFRIHNDEHINYKIKDVLNEITEEEFNISYI